MLLVLALVGCVRPDIHCETVEIDVADDEADLGDLDFTVNEILARLEGVRTFPASDVLLQPLAAELELSRADGTAVFSDATLVGGRKGGIRFYHDDIYIHRECDDFVEVPITYTLTTADGSFAVHGETNARAAAFPNADGHLTGVSFTDPVDLIDATLPERPAPATGAQLDAFFAGADLESASVGWTGTLQEALRFPPAQVTR